MSDNELIRKYYHGLYQTNSHGSIVCPLYNEKNEDNQICEFSVENETDSLTPEQFKCFWSHVESCLGDTYRDILIMCRSKIVSISKTSQYENLCDTIGSTWSNLNKLVNSWSHTSLNDVQLINSFKAELALLEKKMIEIVKPIVHINSSDTTLPNL